jgi:thioesterase domain-containing protein
MEELIRESRGSSDLTISVPLELRGIFNASALQQAFEILIRRHSRLRTFAVLIEEQLYIRVRRADDCRLLTQLQTLRTVDELNTAQTHRFDLTRELPIRLSVFPLNSSRHIVLIVLHRIAADLWSLKPLVWELIKLYLAYISGAKPVLPPTLRSFAAGAWSERTGMPSIRTIGPDSMKTAGLGAAAVNKPAHDYLQVSRGAIKSIGVRLNSFFHHRLVNLAGLCDADVDSVLYAAISSTLHHLNGDQNTFFAAEERIPGTASRKAIGLYSHMFLMNCCFREPMTFRDLVSATARARRRETDHDIVRIGSLAMQDVLDLNLRARENHLPIGSVLMMLRSNKEEVALRLNKSRFTAKIPAAPLYPFDICFDLIEHKCPLGSPNGIEGRVAYRANYYSQSFIEETVSTLTSILTNALAVCESGIQRISCGLRGEASISETQLSPERGAMPEREKDLTLRLTANQDTHSIANRERVPAERTRYLKPTNPTHHLLLKIWQQTLGLDRIGMQDDFFDLGGNQELLCQMMKFVEMQLGRRLKEPSAVERLTVDGMTRELVRGVSKTLCRNVLPERAGSKRPLFLFHGDLDGGGYYAHKLCSSWCPDQPLYICNPHGLDGTPVPASIGEMAEAYLCIIRTIEPRGPFYLAGYCGAGLVAFEAARKLKEQGEAIGWLGLIASRYKDDYEIVSLTQELATLHPSKRYFGVTSTYSPPWYDGTVTVFSPSKHPAVESDYDHWSRVAKEVRVVPIQGSHATCLTRSVEDLGRRIGHDLHSAQRHDGEPIGPYADSGLS